MLIKCDDLHFPRGCFTELRFSTFKILSLSLFEIFFQYQDNKLTWLIRAYPLLLFRQVKEITCVWCIGNKLNRIALIMLSLKLCRLRNSNLSVWSGKCYWENRSFFFASHLQGEYSYSEWHLYTYTALL